jgi:NAD(P)-dependent dehydrogenase (short-subunit alcohol dehydrogenase family)
MKPNTIIIGGTRGIGRALAGVMAREGHRVSVLGRNAPAGKIATGVRFWQADVLKRKAMGEVFDEIISDRGPLNYLICLQRFKGEGDPWESELETSLSATRWMIEHLGDNFDKRADKGIVLVSSAAGSVIADEQPVGYHVAKAGVCQMARYYAVTLGPRGVRVNAVSPGTVLKAETREYYRKHKKNFMTLFEKTVPLRRMGTADEVAQAIAFLCSARASFITGQHLLVDGGISLLSQETLLQKFAQKR